MASRTCTECGKPLGNDVRRKTCSTACRSKRSRRIARARKSGAEAVHLPPGQKEVSERVSGEAEDIAHKVIEEELRPVVRDAITEDTMRAIQKMVGMTPLAVAAIEEDLRQDDLTIRQRAYTLLMKYTVGHQAIVRPPEDDPNRPLNVTFNLPRPEQPSQDVIDAEVVSEADDHGNTKCDTCGEFKTPDQLVASSERCFDCFNKQKERAAEIILSE